ncbi:MAG TPA: bifunctional diguanylate cyclase/phosphodiesterase [Actinomycetales bacterium]|nr:bifunctional diguanylate cyclase/phosphodiesterase [Actinomycetales bacterium]
MQFIVAGVAAACLVALLGVTGAGEAVATGAVLSGALTLLAGVAGLVAMWRRRRSAGRPTDERFRVLLLWSAVAWALGQVTMGFQVGAGAAFPTTGDVLSLVAVPLAVAGALQLPRPGREPQRGLRVAFEALMVAGAAEGVLWVFWFRGPRGAAFDDTQLLSLAILSCELLLVALLFVGTVRDPEVGSVVATAGLAVYVTGDLLMTHAAPGSPGERFPWMGAAISCLAFPMIVFGIHRIRGRRHAATDVQTPREELRRSIVTSAAVLVPLLVYLYGLLRDEYLDAVSASLAAAVAVGFAGREVVRGHQTHGLLSRLAHQAHHDPLTGLRNRRALTDALGRTRNEARRNAAPAAVLTLDIDRFKEVNSQFGHAVGDQVLVAVADCLRRTCAETDATAYRLGGDEFAILARGSLAQCRALAERLRAAVNAGIGEVPGLVKIDLTASLGLAPVRSVGAPGGSSGAPGGEDRLEPLSQAAQALRVAKDGRNRVWVYDDILAEHARARATTERRLALAVDNGGVGLHFQPIVQLPTGRVRGLEALARWDDAELGQVPPDRFIALAEQTGLIHRLGRRLLDDAVRVVSELPSHLGLNVGVNVSPLQLRDPRFITDVVETLHRYGLPPKRLILEVTEGIFMDPDDPAVHALHELSQLGVVIAIDDFGSGYSSFGYMSRLPVDIVKVDRALTRSLDVPAHRAVLRAIVDMATALHLDVVFEGIETVEAEWALASIGAGFGQGWLYSAAVPRDRILQVVRDVESAQGHLDEPVVPGPRVPTSGVVGEQPEALAVGGDDHVS